MAPRLLLALLLGATLLVSAGSAATARPCGRSSTTTPRTRLQWGERTLTRRSVPRLRQAWAANAGASIEGSVAVGDGLAFVGSDNNVLHAYRADGSEAWSQALENHSAFVASPAATGNTVFAYSSSAVRHGAGRRERASFAGTRSVSGVRGAFPGSPTLAGGLLYVVPDELVALDAATGETRWSRPSVGCFMCSPAVAKGTLYVGAGPASGRRLLALDAGAARAALVVSPAGRHGFSWSASPAVAGGRVFQAAFVGRGTKKYSLYAFTAAAGRRVWKAPVGSSRVLTSSSPAVANGVVYYVSPGSHIYALRASNGKRLGRRTIATSASSPWWPAGLCTSAPA